MYVIRKNGLAHSFMSADGSWVDYKQAKRFKTQDEASNFAKRFLQDDSGIFPVSHK